MNKPESLSVKFWVINGVALFIIGCFLYFTIATGIDQGSIYQMTPFQAIAVIAVFYIFGEGKLVHKVQVAKSIQKHGVHDEFKTVHKASDKVDISRFTRG